MNPGNELFFEKKIFCRRHRGKIVTEPKQRRIESIYISNERGETASHEISKFNIHHLRLSSNRHFHFMQKLR